jgi:hypothetical protein
LILSGEVVGRGGWVGHGSVLRISIGEWKLDKSNEKHTLSQDVHLIYRIVCMPVAPLRRLTVLATWRVYLM